MKSKFLVAAVSAGFLFGAAQTALAADAPKAPKLTNAIAKSLQDAQKAGNAKDYPTALAHERLVGASFGWNLSVRVRCCLGCRSPENCERSILSPRNRVWRVCRSVATPLLCSSKLSARH